MATSSARNVVTLKNSVPADWITAAHQAARPARSALAVRPGEPALERAAGREQDRADEEGHARRPSPRPVARIPGTGRRGSTPSRARSTAPSSGRAVTVASVRRSGRCGRRYGRVSRQHHLNGMTGAFTRIRRGAGARTGTRAHARPGHAARGRGGRSKSSQPRVPGPWSRSSGRRRRPSARTRSDQAPR